MADVVKLIGESFEIYKKNYMVLIVPILIILAISIVFGIPQYILSNVQMPVKTPNDLQLMIALTIITTLIGSTFIAIGEFLAVFFKVALQPVMLDLIQGKAPSSWSENLKKQAMNSAQIGILQLIVTLIVALPLIIWFVLNIGVVLAIVNIIAANVGKNNAGTSVAITGVLLGANLMLLIVLGIVSGILSFVLNLFLMFIMQEVVLGGKSLIAGITGSISLVLSNIVDVAIFYIVWFGIGVVFSIISSLSICCPCLCCLGPILFKILQVLALAPIQMVSTVYLWAALAKKVGAPAATAAAPLGKPALAKKK